VPFLGSPVHRLGQQSIVAVASAPIGEGYWLVAANGAVYNYGSSAFCGSPVHVALKSPIVAIAPSPDDGGYRLVAADGVVYAYGDVRNLGSLPAAARRRDNVVGIASTADGRGYWIATSTGTIYRFGDAASFGSPAAQQLTRPIVSIVATADDGGYWLTTADGRIFNYGDARFVGSLAHKPPPDDLSVVQLMPSYVAKPGLVALPHGAFGYDISSYQCKSPGSTIAKTGLPATSAVSVLQVAGWLDGADNSCLAAEAAWATKAAGPTGAPYSLYLFVNAPDNTAAGRVMAANGPLGVCSAATGETAELCEAYNYGFNGAKQAFAYATQQGVQARLWWLDIEGLSLSPTRFSSFAAGHYWSKWKVLNDATIQGALDALRGAGVQVGLYSTSYEFPIIAGAFVPTGARLPLWVAGVPHTKPPYSQAGLPSPSVLGPWCAGTATYSIPGSPQNDLFAGGVPVMLQETPGTVPSPYGVDPDYSC